jgi:ketosteroid isomerase-like protein
MSRTILQRLAIMLLIAAVAAPATAAPAAPQTSARTAEADTVRARRLAYNQAIAGRHPEAMADFLTPGFVQMSSNGVITIGSDKVRARYDAEEFGNPAFIGYDRQPDTVAISANGRFAIERGHWRGRFRTATGGETGNTGLYQAIWIKQDGVWRLRSESYGRLTCASESDCP